MSNLFESLGPAVIWVSNALSDHKMLFEHSVGFDSDALHVLVGLGVQIIAATILRRPISNRRPWLAVLVLELTNEVNDLFHEQWPQVSMQVGEGVKDVLLTMAVPTLLLILTRTKPKLFRERR